LVTLEIKRLSAEAFAPFGDIVTFDGDSALLVNDGWALRANSAAQLAGDAGKPVLAIYRAESRDLPLQLTTLERHPFSSQTFVAIGAPRFLVVVAPPDPQGLPDAARAQAFVGEAGEGINYRPGVWHAPITALDQSGDFIMLMWERGTEDDCVVHQSPTPLLIAEADTGKRHAARP
jgi:ureidoglycolate lyase